ncbi:MAG: hypothetical protein ACOYNI_07770 [Acidimicrobiia bacterium]
MLALAALASACSESTPTTANRPPRIALFGDSVALETYPYLQLGVSVHGATVDAAVRGGTAPCDWMNDFRRVVKPGRFDDIVVLFVGNRGTNCSLVNGRIPTVDEALVEYRRDVSEMVRIATVARTRIHLVDPMPVDATQHPDWVEFGAKLTSAYDDIVARYPMQADTMSLVPAFGTTFRRTDTCRADETSFCAADGTLTMRTADGIHLCPVSVDEFIENRGNCPQLSPGARRLAQVLAGRLAPNP